jgi:hypothetical protein
MFTIDGHEFTDLQLRVLPYFKSSNIILGLPTLKKLDVVIHHSMIFFNKGGFKIKCNRESRRISCMRVDTYKMNYIIMKQARKKKNSTDAFHVFLHFAEKLAILKSDFGE